MKQISCSKMILIKQTSGQEQIIKQPLKNHFAKSLAKEKCFSLVLRKKSTIYQIVLKKQSILKVRLHVTTTEKALPTLGHINTWTFTALCPYSHLSASLTIQICVSPVHSSLISLASNLLINFCNQACLPSHYYFGSSDMPVGPTYCSSSFSFRSQHIFGAVF